MTLVWLNAVTSLLWLTFSTASSPPPTSDNDIEALLFGPPTAKPPEDPMCVCNETTDKPAAAAAADSMTLNALAMQEAMRNKTTLISKIHHRMTHSQEAWRASMAVSMLLALILIGVYFSKMWREKDHLAYMQKQPVKFQQNTTKEEMLVKDMIKYRARSLVKYLGGRRRPAASRSASATNLRMETFIRATGDGDGEAETAAADEVDYHNRLLLSDDADGDTWSSDDVSGLSGDDELFYAMDKASGEWVGKGEAASASGPHLHDRRKKTQQPSRLKSFVSKFRGRRGAAASAVKTTGSVNFDGSDVKLLASDSSDNEAI